ncbi:MAG: hypothetical protein IJT06_01665, partial [Selenomonadaceae bacterium]|nr:hypothetical protein [Selenomonadaceae bacterium]
MIDAVKISITENNVETHTFNFNEVELKNFALAITDMVDEGKEIDFVKAAHNAKYFSEIDRHIAEMEKIFPADSVSFENKNA